MIQMEMKLPYLVVKIKIVPVLLTEKCHENRFGCTEYVKWNSRFVFSSSQIADTDVVVHLQYNLQMITLGRLYSFIDYKASGFSMTVVNRKLNAQYGNILIQIINL